MATKTWAIILVLVTTLLTSSAQLSLKYGINKANPGILGILTNYYIISGFLIYCAAGILAIVAFRHGDVTVLYPVFATSYVWVSISSYYILGEHLNFASWIGISSIVIGVSLLGFHRKKNMVMV